MHFWLLQSGLLSKPAVKMVNISTVLNQPTAIGTLTLRSGDFHDPPMLNPNLLSQARVCCLVG